MKTTATTLYPFVPSGLQFARSLEFFEALGFVKQWESNGLAGLRFGGAYFLLQDINVPGDGHINVEVRSKRLACEQVKRPTACHPPPKGR